jgi:hypothetical protein
MKAELILYDGIKSILYLKEQFQISTMVTEEF